MMIRFKKVRWKNIMSYGDHFTELDLDRSPSTLITGENGSGKSTVCEAICFALFGKSFRKIKKNELINFKNERGSVAEIEFDFTSSGQTDTYKIVRGIKPDVFQIYKNDDLVNQNSSSRDYQTWLQNNVLRCDHSIFTQIVMIGQANHTSFMRMRAPERRNFVETVLNLHIFTQMNSLHTTKMNVLKDSMQSLKTKHALKEKDIDHQKKFIAEHEKNATIIFEKETDRINSEIEKLNSEISLIQNKIQELSSLVQTDVKKNIKNLKKKEDEIKSLLVKAAYKIENHEKSIASLKKQDVCTCCGQDIDEAMKNKKISSIQKDLLTIDATKNNIIQKQSDVVQKIKDLEIVDKSNDKINQEISSNQYLLKDKNNSLNTLNKSLNGLKKDNKDLTKERTKLQKLLDELLEIEDEKNKCHEDMEYSKVIKVMLNDDGIKASMIKKLIPTINSVVNSNLTKLGFFGKIDFDGNFDETIRTRGVDTLSYFSHSEGEKLRIDLAVLLAWREIAKMQGIIDTNLLFFDEVMDASMDASGTDAFATLLNQLSKSNIFIITHSPDKVFDKVKSQITFFRDKNGFSKILTK